MTDFFVAGSWRNRTAIDETLAAMDAMGATASCFVRAVYPASAALLARPGGADEADLRSPAVREVFDQDLEALQAATAFLLVLPAGRAAHIEAGIAYGLGKRCYAIGPVERSETLYRIFDRMFPDVAGFERWLAHR